MKCQFEYGEIFFPLTRGFEMQTKPYTAIWAIILLTLLLVTPGCMSVTGSQNAIPVANTSIFNHKRIAVLPVKMQTSLAPDSVMAMTTEVNKRLAPVLRTKIPSARVTDITDVVNLLNQTNSLTNFEQLLSSYEATGVMDKRQVIALGQVLNCDYLLISRLKSEKLDVGFISKGAGASLDVLLVNSVTSEIAWAGSGEWKKGGIFGQGGAAFSEFADNIITPAFESLQSSGSASEVAPPPTAYQEPPPAKPKKNAKRKKISNKIVSQVQQQLLGLGYQPGPVDGVLGKGTVNAIKQFQKDNNLSETGQADSNTLKVVEEKSEGQTTQPGNQPQPSTSTLTPQKEPPPLTTGTELPETTKKDALPAKSVSPMDL